MTIYDQRGQHVDTQYNAGRDIIIRPPRQLTERQRRNRSRMLERVRSFWVEGVLENSLHGAALIELGLTYQPEAVQHPWEVIVQEPHQPPRTLAHGTKVLEVFQTNQEELLILGAPGSGKTTLLLELARDLLTIAAEDEAQPMPVVFNLSSWATQRRSLAEWLVDELNERYDVPRNIGQAWVKDDTILPLLDGLDEVQQEHRVACVEAINAFRRDHGMAGLVVCSRSTDYELLEVRLKLKAAVLIQPLTPQQIDAYLARADDQLAGLRLALADDAILQELAESPLMLSIMALVYRGMPSDALVVSGPTSDRRQQLFAAYVERMFARRGMNQYYLRAQTSRWLHWLAHAMMQQGQSVFLIEQLQPDWLPTRTTRWLYGMLDHISGLLLGLFFGLYIPLVNRLLLAQSSQLTVDLYFSLRFGLVVGLILGLFGGVRQLPSRTQLRMWWSIRNGILGGLVGIFVGGLVNGVIFWQLFRWAIEGTGVSMSPLFFGLLYSLPGAQIGALIGGPAGALIGPPGMRLRHIEVVETLHWSWANAVRSGVSMLVGGLTSGLLYSLVWAIVWWLAVEVQGIDSELAGWFVLGLGMLVGGGLPFGIALGVAGSMAGGLIGGQIETKVAPNEGVWRSARTALLSGLCGGLIFGLFFGIIVKLSANSEILIGFDPISSALLDDSPDKQSTWQFHILVGVLTYGLLYGMVFWLMYGGYACLSHLALRFIIWRKGYLPWNIVRFLDYCTERIFLRKVGGGYIFVHRLLLEYFATLDTKQEVLTAHEQTTGPSPQP